MHFFSSFVCGYFRQANAETAALILTLITPNSVLPRKNLPLVGPAIDAPHLWDQIPPKPLQKGRKQAISSQIAISIKLRYYQNYETDFYQILYNDKDHREHIVGGPAHAYNKSKMADGRYIKNIKSVIIPQPCN